MTPEKFVQDIREEIINNRLESYKNTFRTVTESPDQYWHTALVIYNQLAEKDKDALLGFIRLIIVNSISHFFGILDGSSYLNNERDSVVLLDETTDKRLNNFLQDIFLEMEQQHKD